MNKSFGYVVSRVAIVVYAIALVGIDVVEAGQESTSSVLGTANKPSRNVLPFVNHGSNPESDWIGVGIAVAIARRRKRREMVR